MLHTPPYYAVIFINTLDTHNNEGYEETAHKMVELAKSENGFLSLESVRDSEGKGITVSYWQDTQSIENWKNNVDHQLARQKGKENWYLDYQLQIAKVESGYRWCRT